MKVLKILTISLMVLGLCSAFVFAMSDTPADRGKALFNDPAFAGGNKACSSCHPDGSGLENAAGKKVFGIMGKKQASLEDAVNFCIVNAINGKAIDVKSEQMKDMVAYIKSLKAKSPKAAGY